MNRIKFATFAAALLLFFLSTYRLTESPPIWTDEGHLIQVAMNAALHGPQAQLQVAPGKFESGAFSATTGYPALFPVAVAFSLFGVTLVSARLVMAVFILLFVFVAWRLAVRHLPLPLPAHALLLLSTFAPLYGNGNNVLGEIPGLLFLTF